MSSNPEQVTWTEPGSPGLERDAAAGRLVPAAYGFRIRGFEADGFLDLRAAEHWPTLHVRRRQADTAHWSTHVGNELGVLAGRVGGVLLDRRRRIATFADRARPVADQIVHPGLTTAGAVLAQWWGREAFHAGAFLDRRLVWVVIGDHEAGKSTLLAQVARTGRDVVADDLVVVDGLRCFAGPRCVDLREDAAERIGAGDKIEASRSGGRARLRLSPTLAEHRLGGWLFLQWGPVRETCAIRPPDRLPLLSEARTWSANDPRALLRLAALPAWRIVRPTGLEHLKANVAQVLEATARGSAG